MLVVGDRRDGRMSVMEGGRVWRRRRKEREAR
jgi:hypothetical protein